MLTSPVVLQTARYEFLVAHVKKEIPTMEDFRFGWLNLSVEYNAFCGYLPALLQPEHIDPVSEG